MQTYLMVLILVLVLLFLYSLMIRPTFLNKSDLKWLTQVDYAHRGLFKKDQTIPENSINAYHLAVREQFGIEIDVQMTRDEVLVLYHDLNLKRLNGVDLVLQEETFSTISKYPLNYTNEYIPTLEQTLTLVNGQVPLLIEIKESKRYKQTVDLTMKQLSKYKGLYAMQSFDPKILYYLRRHYPQVIRGQLAMHNALESQAWLKNLPLEFLLFNFLTKPHFISYHCKSKFNPSFLIVRFLGAITLGWTINSDTSLMKNMKSFDSLIFEHVKSTKFLRKYYKK